ncbi:MAG TPA: CBS domain-containing protein [Rudaea sp.]
MKQVSQVMTRNVQLARPDDSIREAARMMAQNDIGSLPVGDENRLVGMITDRDIVVRAVADGKDVNTKVRDVMTDEIRYCYDDDDIDAVAENMSNLGIRRLCVIDRDQRLVGIVSLSNVAQGGDDDATDTLLQGVAEPH